MDAADEEYVARLVRLARNMGHRSRFRILAFDKHYDAAGNVDLKKTHFYLPNRYVVELAEKYPDIFLPVISVHPYRPDALEELDRWADYPLPAINALIWTRSLARDGFITDAEREAVNEIYDYNPLLFDFVLKRTARHRQTKQKLAASVFAANPGLERRRLE
jgi:hypothetical protein